VDPVRIGLAGWSLGGYYAPRAAAFEKRLALVVAWGANHNWGAVQRRRLEREGERPVPHYWEHVLWVWGQPDTDTFIKFADQIHLDGVVSQISVPFLICHGANDRQIPVEYAHRCYDQAAASPRRELRIFTPQEGGAEHIGLDHLPYVSTYIALGRRRVPLSARRESGPEHAVRPGGPTRRLGDVTGDWTTRRRLGFLAVSTVRTSASAWVVTSASPTSRTTVGEPAPCCSTLTDSSVTSVIMSPCG
jgi:hypothetical protein